MRDHIDLVLISDTHELHRGSDVPAGDILRHAGDFTMFSRSLETVEDFNNWLGDLGHRHKLIVPGNHEFFLQPDLNRTSLLTNATVLVNETVVIDGLRFWGSPVTPLLGSVFGIASPKERLQHWSGMPDLDILITHGPPFGVLDRSSEQDEPMGDAELLDVVRKRQPLLHVFGHVHGAYGQVSIGKTLFVNAAMLGVHGSLKHGPVVIRLPRRN